MRVSRLRMPRTQFTLLTHSQELVSEAVLFCRTCTRNVDRRTDPFTSYGHSRREQVPSHIP
jgi:hypothetical protein